MSKRLRVNCIATTAKKLAKKGVVKLTSKIVHPILSGSVYKDVKTVLRMETSRDATYKAGLRRHHLHNVDLQEEHEENTQLLLIKVI
jgi:hypothetical protein